MSTPERTECAELSERLHELAGKFDALGWDRHGSEIRSMAAHIVIYGHQLSGRIEGKPLFQKCPNSVTIKP